MKKIIVFVLIIFCFFCPANSYSQALPGSVNDALENDQSYSLPVEQSELTDPREPLPIQDEFVKAVITKIVSEYTEPSYAPDENFFIQEIEATILTGREKGTVVHVRNEVPEQDRELKNLTEGQKIIIGKSIIADEIQYYISDIYRLNSLWLVLFIFVILTLLFTKFQGIRAFIGLLLSFVVIGWYIVPQIIHGGNPLITSLIGTTIIAATSLYVAHGFHSRTSIALVGTFISIVVALILSYLFVRITYLFGMGSEEAFYLQFAPGITINLRGLLLGGIIIGIMGILDDITTAQAAVVEQIYHANPELSAHELYRRGTLVGREHILSLVNTLVLAYTGASLPLILLFIIYQRPAWVTLNSEIIMEEIIRMIIGSVALIIAVPITTFIAARYYSRVRPKSVDRVQKTDMHHHVH